MMSIFRDGLFSGYDVIIFIKKEFGVNLSSGTIYAHLYSIERKKLIECVSENDRKRLYRVTEKGKLMLDVVTSAKEVEEFMKRILS